MLEKFRSLPFNTKVIISVAIVLVFVITIFSLASLSKMLFPASQQEIQTSVSSPSPSNTIGIPNITIEETVKAPGDPSDKKTYGNFTSSEINDYTAQAQITATKLCLKDIGETEEAISARLNQYFSSVTIASNYIANKDILERKCIFMSTQPLFIDTKINTVKVSISGSSYEINYNQSGVPTNERQINKENISYNFVMAKNKEGTIQVIEIG